VTDRDDESTGTIHAGQAARALASVQPSTTPPPIGDRAAAIDAIERALRGRARRRWQRRWVLPSLAVAAAAAAASVVLVVGSHRVDVHGGGPRLVGLPASGGGLNAGTELRGPGSFEIAAGTRLRLDAQARAQVLEAGQSRRFRLSAGALHAEVAKLRSNQRFVVETPDAEVEVKGTRFEVAVGASAAPCAPATQTSVSVEEGIVAVRFAGHELALGPGQSWPESKCPVAVGAATAGREDAPRVATARISSFEPSAPVRVPVSASALAAAPGRAVRAAGLDRRPRALVRPLATTGAPASNASTLAEQNDLMAAALSARQRGNVEEARRWLDRLLDRYPAGQLADSARAERRRLLGDGLSPREPEPR